MTFLIVLMCVVVAVLLLKPAIKKAPAIWYAAAIALALLYIGVLQGLLPLPVPVRNVLFLLLQRHVGGCPVYCGDVCRGLSS